jgi:hypothetical protein
MLPNAPNFPSSLDPNKFQVQGTEGLKGQLGQAQEGVDSLNYDWSNVNALINMEAGQQQGADARVAGQGLTAGDQTRMGQQNLSQVSNDPAQLGKAMMQLGSKMSTQQEAQAGQAQHQQQMQALQQATQLKQQQAAQRIQMYKSQLALNDQKFQMSEAIKNTSSGLDLANLTLKNMYNAAVSKARNAEEIGNITAQFANFNEIMTYVGAGLQTASTAAAAGAAATGGNGTNATDASNANQMATQGYIGPNSSVYNSANMAASGNPLFQSMADRAGSNNFAVSQDFYKVAQ